MPRHVDDGSASVDRDALLRRGEVLGGRLLPLEKVLPNAWATARSLHEPETNGVVMGCVPKLRSHDQMLTVNGNASWMFMSTVLETRGAVPLKTTSITSQSRKQRLYGFHAYCVPIISMSSPGTNHIDVISRYLKLVGWQPKQPVDVPKNSLNASHAP